jgi:hypothetical protein
MCAVRSSAFRRRVASQPSRIGRLRSISTDIRCVRGRMRDRVHAVGCLDDIEPRQGELLHVQLPQLVLVLDDQHQRTVALAARATCLIHPDIRRLSHAGKRPCCSGSIAST